jgi:hypothetical protein
MKTTKYLIERIEELAVSLAHYKGRASKAEGQLKDLRGSFERDLSVYKGEIEVLKSIIEDQKQTIFNNQNTDENT